MKKPKNEDASLDMTPMIDVVFQLIIFFVVTLKMSDDKDKTIRLTDGKNGIVLTQDEMPRSQITIDVAKSGRISMANITITPEDVKNAVEKRVKTYGDDFPCMIRADRETEHRHIKRVMDACTAAGIWKISVVEIHKRAPKK